MSLVVHETAEAVAEAAAQRISGLIGGSERRFSLGLAGGSTPAATYEALRDRAVAWDRVDAWLSDERWVMHDSERSNGRMVSEALMDHVDARFHRPQFDELVTPQESAATYETQIRRFLDGERPDVVMLGMGSDGHTASLFPGTSALAVDDRWYVANEVPQQSEWRLTATYPLLWSARLLIVLIVGEAKAGALRDSLDGKTPAGRLVDGEAEVEWHVDTAAASLVS